MARKRTARGRPRRIRGRLSIDASEVLASIRARGGIALLFTNEDGQQSILIRGFGRRRNARRLRARVEERFDEIAEVLRQGCSDT